MSSWGVEKATSIGAAGKKSRCSGCGEREERLAERRLVSRGRWKGGGNVALGFTHQRWWLSSEGDDKKTIEGAGVNSAR